MSDEEWDRLVGSVGESDVAGALARVRARGAARRASTARRRRLMGLAAAFALTFGAGLLAGRATAPARGATRMWALGGASMQASRATFVAVPAGRDQ